MYITSCAVNGVPSENRTPERNRNVIVLPSLDTEAAGRAALEQGKVLFVVNIPAGFTRQLLRHEHPAVLIEADATTRPPLAMPSSP